MTDGWEIEYSMAEMAYRVRVNGEWILDENGRVALYEQPKNLLGIDEYRQWANQLLDSIQRMSGTKITEDQRKAMGL